MGLDGCWSCRSALRAQRDPSYPSKSRLVITPSVENTLRDLVLFLSDRLRVPTLIISPPGAGKSLIIHHLASQLFPSSPSHVISLHLSDTSIDPKSLLGSYVPSSTKPGTFEWIEGARSNSMLAVPAAVASSSASPRTHIRGGAICRCERCYRLADQQVPVHRPPRSDQVDATS